MSERYVTPTKVGNALIAKAIAEKKTLEITKVMFGSGSPEDGVDPTTLTDLVEPVAQGTATSPKHNGATVSMTLQYRNNLNGDITEDFPIQEFGLFTRIKEDAAETPEGVLLFYGNLGDTPQIAVAYNGYIDTHSFPINIAVSESATIVISFSADAFLTEAELIKLLQGIYLPQFLNGDVAAAISEHNSNAAAHPYILKQLDAISSRLGLLELMLRTNVDKYQFSVTLETLDDVVVTGVWDTEQQYVRF